MAVTMNGERPRIVDHTGQPWEENPNRFSVPPVLTHASILNQSLQVYSAIRRDDAIKFGRQDALAMERDTFLQGLMLELYESIALLDGQVECEDPKDPRQVADAEWHQKIVERTPYFQQYKINLLYAIWFGRSANQNVISRTDARRRPTLVQGKPVWVVSNYAPVRGDKIEFGYQLDDDHDNPDIEEGTPLIFINPAHTERIERLGGKIHRSDQFHALILTPGYWRDRFVIHKHLTKDWDPFEEPERQGCIHGYGVRDQIFWMDWVRKEWLSNVSDFIDQVGKGCQLYPYDASNPANETKAIEAAQKQSRNTVIVWPIWPGQNVQMLPQPMNTPMDGSKVLLDLMQHMEGIIERYIIGQTGSSRDETSGLGTHSGDAMANTKYRRIRRNAQALDETLTEQLLGPLHRWNSPQAQYKLFYKTKVDKPNAAEMLQSGTALFQMNVPFKADEIRSYAGYTKPEEGDELVSQQQVQQAQLQMESEAGGGQEAEEAKVAAEVKKQELALKAASQKNKLEMDQARQKHQFEMQKMVDQHRMKQQSASQAEVMKRRAALQQMATRQRVP